MRDLLHPLDPDIGDFKRDPGGPAGHVDGGLPSDGRLSVSVFIRKLRRRICRFIMRLYPMLRRFPRAWNPVIPILDWTTIGKWRLLIALNLPFKAEYLLHPETISDLSVGTREQVSVFPIPEDEVRQNFAISIKCMNDIRLWLHRPPGLSLLAGKDRPDHFSGKDDLMLGHHPSITIVANRISRTRGFNDSSRIRSSKDWESVCTRGPAFTETWEKTFLASGFFRIAFYTFRDFSGYVS